MRIDSQGRITPAHVGEILRLSFSELGREADEIRRTKNPGNDVTYVVDANPNYTNVCDVDCIFCAFYRSEGDSEAYTYSNPEMKEKFAELKEKKVKTVLLQGGVNPRLKLSYYERLIRDCIDTGLFPHFFSTAEIKGIATAENISTEMVLRALWGAGQRTLPGGGAEILSERPRRIISRKKGDPGEWIRIMEEAHRIGFRSTATMMYGHLETEEEIIDHFDLIRSLQDRTGGFTSFVPWSFKPGNTLLEKKVKRVRGPSSYFRILALARLYLDNFDHVQASWFSEGKDTGVMALHYGADDFGGTLLVENVHKAADFINTTTEEEIQLLISDAGYNPVERNPLYEKVMS